MKFAMVGLLFSVMVFPSGTGVQRPRDDSSCTQIDFDEATLTSMRQCDYTQEFIVKPYNESDRFDPYRPDALYYLSNRWQGLTCGETVTTYSFNAETELRMAYNLLVASGATLEVRVYDLERDDSDNDPILVEVWRTAASTDGWGFFREKLNKTVKQAKIQIEANINAGSELAIEYLTIFNYEVETEDCSAIDEFLTTTENAPTTTTYLPTATEPTTVTFPATTTSTVLSTVEEITTPPTTEVSDERSTTTSEAATTTTTVTSTRTTMSSTTETVTVTTTTNAPRDDTSMVPSSITQELTSTTILPTESSTLWTTSTVPATLAPSLAGVVRANHWLWMTLAGLFGTMFVLAASAVSYLWFVNLQLDRATISLLQELSHSDPHTKKSVGLTY